CLPLHPRRPPAEVKPFVPKHAAVTVAWSEPSEACVFPRYLTTCYPFVQEPSLDKYVYFLNLVSWDPAFREYSSCSYSSDVVANVYPVAGSQYHSNNSTQNNGSGIVSESAEQTYPIRRESKTVSKVSKYMRWYLKVMTSLVNKALKIMMYITITYPGRFTAFNKTFNFGKPFLFFRGRWQSDQSGSLTCSTSFIKDFILLCFIPVAIQMFFEWFVIFFTFHVEVDQNAFIESSKKSKLQWMKALRVYYKYTIQNNGLYILKWKPLLIGTELVQETSRSSGKKSQIPVQLDLGGMLAVLEQKQQTEKSKQSSKPVVFSVGGAIPLLSKEPATATKSHRLNQGKMPHNPLDSSAPLVKKGKQREVPKAKRPTPLKKVLIFFLKYTEVMTVQEVLNKLVLSWCFLFCLCIEVSSFTLIAVPVTQVAEVLLESTGIKDSTEGSMTSKQLTSRLPKIHSRNFRDYCSQVLSKEVDSCVTDLLKELVRFQDRLYQKDPVKAKIKRRLVMGLREVLKHLKLKKLKCVIISPNCEKIQSKGGLDETLHNIIDCACEQNIPFVFALNRKALGRCVNKAVPVSVVGIFSYDGAQDHFHRMVQLTTEARKAYKDMIAALEKEAEGGLKETQPSISATEYEKNSLSEMGKTSFKDSDEDVPNYIKIWKRKLEEEYNPYALELEESATTDVIVNSEEHQ
uniref:SECIS binding protein 2 n=1 Tax=Falco tinnunculus TaxID=100819 RepID=A0A8C4XTP9_FALTI